MKISKAALSAIYLGTLCSLSYLGVYIVRNVLSAATPDMITSNGYTEAYLGEVASMFFIVYAVGQLINGVIGDRIKAKWMISFGLLFAGIFNFVFCKLIDFRLPAMIAYGMMGFFLAMIYGPMSKVVSESMNLVYATRCTLGFTFASFIGTPSAGLLASFLGWQDVFTVSSIVVIVMAIACFICFEIFERKGIVKYNMLGDKKNKDNTEKKSFKDIIKMLLGREIIKYTLVSIITGIVRTSVVFWLPTYISQWLNFDPKTSAALYTAATLIISFTAFIAVFVYERLGRNMGKTLLVMFVVAAACFFGVYFVKQAYINIALMVLAIMASNGATTMLWSCYCPSLADTGLVSSVTGFLDFFSYMAAAVANILFAHAVTGIGWGNLILVWTGITLAGVIVSIPWKVMFKKQDKWI